MHLNRASEAGSSDHEIVKNMAHYSDGASISEPDDDRYLEGQIISERLLLCLSFEHI